MAREGSAGLNHPELMQVKLHVRDHVTHGLSLRRKSFKGEF